MYFQRLKDLREDSDLKQKDIAKILNTHTNYYGEYEKGNKEITVSRLLQLADFYKVSLDYITGRTNDKRGLTRSDLPDEQANIIRTYRNLSEKRKGVLLGVLRQLEAEQQEENAKRKDAI